MKKTKRQMFNELLAIEAVSANEEMVAFIEHEIKLLDKKHGSNSKPTKNQIANETIKEAIMDVLENADSGMTITQVIDEGATLNGLSNQKVSALMRQLVAEGKVDRYKDKKTTLFKIAD